MEDSHLCAFKLMKFGLCLVCLVRRGLDGNSGQRGVLVVVAPARVVRNGSKTRAGVIETASRDDMMEAIRYKSNRTESLANPSNFILRDLFIEEEGTHPPTSRSPKYSQRIPYRFPSAASSRHQLRS